MAYLKGMNKGTSRAKTRRATTRGGGGGTSAARRQTTARIGDSVRRYTRGTGIVKTDTLQHTPAWRMTVKPGGYGALNPRDKGTMYIREPSRGSRSTGSTDRYLARAGDSASPGKPPRRQVRGAAGVIKAAQRNNQRGRDSGEAWGK